LSVSSKRNRYNQYSKVATTAGSRLWVGSDAPGASPPRDPPSDRTAKDLGT